MDRVSLFGLDPLIGLDVTFKVDLPRIQRITSAFSKNDAEEVHTIQLLVPAPLLLASPAIGRLLVIVYAPDPPQ